MQCSIWTRRHSELEVRFEDLWWWSVGMEISGYNVLEISLRIAFRQCREWNMSGLFNRESNGYLKITADAVERTVLTYSK